MEVITLYRPTSPQELELVKQNGYTRWSARLPEQPIFYSVTNGEYAKQIAICIDPSDHKLYKFGKLYRARQVLRSLMTDRNTIDEHS